jgi:hypothetical protein
MATWQRYEWISDRLLVRLCSDRAWIERDEKIDWNMYLMDLSDPDVARWVDSKIATSLGLPNPEHAALSYGNEWCFWILADECPRFIGDLRTELANVVRDIPCTDANIPTARAALLRALFGVSNA